MTTIQSKNALAPGGSFDALAPSSSGPSGGSTGGGLMVSDVTRAQRYPAERRSKRRSERFDEALDPFVAALERVLAQDGALCLVVELQVDPVDGVVTFAFLGSSNEVAA